MIELIKGKLYLFGEKVIFQYKDEYDNDYVLTKGFNRYYLYKQSTYLNKDTRIHSYSTVCEKKDAIQKYVEENNLRKVEI